MDETYTSLRMLGSVLICGAGKKDRLEKAREILSAHGFTIDSASPDLLMIQKEDDRKSIGIAQAKEVKKFLRERPFTKKIKAVVVEDAQLLTDDAQGSLLKVLEEPPAFALIIMLCDKEGSLLPTVISRCQKVVLRENRPADGLSTVFNLTDKSYEELFDLAKEMSKKDKDEVIEFLEGLLRYNITVIVSEHSERGNSATASLSGRNRNDIVVEMEKAIKDIKEANVALKFALEYLFLLHKKIALPRPQ